jgi:hypothetical protein
MEDSTKLAIAIIVSAVILVGGYIAYNEYARSRDIGQAQQALDAFRQNAQQLAYEERRSAQASAEQQAANQRWELSRRRLTSNQRCVAGAVVQIQGTSYTQLGTISQPIHCAGNFADQPLR